MYVGSPRKAKKTLFERITFDLNVIAYMKSIPYNNADDNIKIPLNIVLEDCAPQYMEWPPLNIMSLSTKRNTKTTTLVWNVGIL